MGLFGKSGNREMKRSEKQMRSILAQRDAWRAERERLHALRDVNGLIDLIVEMEKKGGSGWPLVLETGQAAASFDRYTMEEFSERPIRPKDAFAFGLVLALVGSTAWRFVLRQVTDEWPDDQMTYLPALAYFAVFEGKEQATAQTLLKEFPSRWAHRFGKGKENPEVRAEVERVREFCSHIHDPDDLEEGARMALDIAEYNRLFGDK